MELKHPIGTATPPQTHSGGINTINPRLEGHLAITDTMIIWSAAKSTAKIHFRRLAEINSHYYRLSLL